MMTSARFSVSWCEGSSRYTLAHSTVRPCIACARALLQVAGLFGIEVRNVDTGEDVAFRTGDEA